MTNCCSNCNLVASPTSEGHYCKARGHLVRAEVYNCEYFSEEVDSCNTSGDWDDEFMWEQHF